MFEISLGCARLVLHHQTGVCAKVALDERRHRARHGIGASAGGKTDEDLDRMIGGPLRPRRGRRQPERQERGGEYVERPACLVASLVACLVASLEAVPHGLPFPNRY
ncbi:hypothetical protein ACU4HD_40330 [Cupriavidus basilensis]